MRITAYVFSSLALGMIFYFPSEDARKTETNISFCQFSLSEDIKAAHESFSVAYTFRLDEEGKPKEIRRVRNSQLGDGPVIACISRWRFTNVAPNSAVVAHFWWEHGVGWTELRVAGKGFTQTLRIDGQRCPYCRTS